MSCFMHLLRIMATRLNIFLFCAGLFEPGHLYGPEPAVNRLHVRQSVRHRRAGDESHSNEGQVGAGT